jgi:Protein kinase domain
VSQLPATIGRYEIKNRIGRGGMGSLYLAWDPMLERQIAIKLLRDDMDELRERFDREARSVARLRHPNIVTIFDVGEQDGQPFIAMEFIHGQTLADIIRQEPQLAVVLKLKIVDELCDGLGFAHKMGIVHRDVKPANVMVEPEGHVKILDFGIARIAESGMTMAGMLIGTLNYMSPEQVAGKVVDGRSDVFAVGSVMYELLSRRQAFPGGLQDGILNRILNEHPPRLETICPGLNPEVIEIIGHALEKDPQNRYQDLTIMRKDLQRVIQLEVASEPTAVVDAEPTDETISVETDREGWRRTPVPRRASQREALARLRTTQTAAHFDAARRAFEAGEFDAAIAAGEQALLLDPEDADSADIVDRARAALDERHVEGLVRQGQELVQAAAFAEAIAVAAQALSILPRWPAAIELRDSAQRLRLAREQERQRMEAVRAATQRAEAALDRGAHNEAIAAAQEALERAPDHGPARIIQRRAQEAIELARKAAFEDLARRTTEEARRIFAQGQHDEALEMLTAFEGRHALITATLEQLRDEKAQIDHEAERQRQQHIDAAIDRATKTASHEEAIGYLREAMTLDVGRADLRELLAEREAALAQERENARLAREREEKILSELTRVRSTASHEVAVEILEGLLALGSDRMDIQEMLEHRRTALEREREQQRRWEQLQKQVSDLLGRASATDSHEGAIDLLTEALALDPARADVANVLASRKAAFEREREEQRRARETAEKIAAAIEQATGTPSHEEALVILRAALALDPSHSQLKTLLDVRQSAREQELEDARRQEERQARLASAVARAAALKAHDAAIGVLSVALERDPGAPELERLLGERQAALEQQRREDRERLERLIAAIAQAGATASHADAVAMLEEAAPLGPENAELRAALGERRAALAREREEARRARERQERVAAAIAQAQRASSTPAAVAILQEAQALAPENEEVRGLLVTVQAKLAQEQEAARQRREREERVAALFKQAKATAAHTDAIRLVRELLELDASHRDGQRLLQQRQAALDKERAEAKRLTDIEAARQSIRQLIAAGQFDMAQTALDRAKHDLGAAKLLKAEGRELKQARAAAVLVEPRRPIAITPRTIAVLVIVAALVIVAVAYVVLRPTPVADTQAGVSPAVPATTQSGSGTDVPRPPQPQAPTPPAEPPVAIIPPLPAPEEPITTEPKSNPEAPAAIPAMVQRARDQVRMGQLQEAMTSLSEVLRLDPANREARALSTDVLSQARRLTSRARAAAAERGEAAVSSRAYRGGQAREAEAGRRERAGQRQEAVRLLSEATTLFTQAERTASAARPAEAAPAPPVKPVSPTPEPSTPPPSLPPATRTEPPATPPATASPTKPAPAPTQQPLPMPPASPPAQSTSVSEREAILATLREYAAAYESLNAEAVRRVFPSIDVARLAARFRDLRAQQVAMTNEQISIDGTTAVVRCKVRQAYTPRVGSGGSQTVDAEFRLQKIGGRWLIVARR